MSAPQSASAAGSAGGNIPAGGPTPHSPGTTQPPRGGADGRADVIELAIDGMTCASCVRRVEQALAATDGVLSASVNLATERAQIQVAPGVDAVPALIEAVRKKGYEARHLEPEAPALSTADVQRKADEQQVLRRQVLTALALTLPVFILEMGGHAIPAFHHYLLHTLDFQNLALLQFVLTTLVLAFPGRVFFTKGLAALLHGAPEMNTLVAVGAGSAWLYSCVSTFAPQWLPEGSVHLYFEAAAVITTLILLGRYLEARAKGRTGEAIRKLMNLQARMARVRRDDAWLDVPADTLKPGDIVLVRPGETLPADGIITEGRSHIDESMITGEPLPVARQSGDTVTGGTLNTNGSITVQIQHTGSDTMLARIIRMVQSAQGAKLPIQALVDKVTAWFVPAVMLLALATFGLWLAFGPSLSLAIINAVAVLIIACPCAMGLATPTSIMVATGRAAELGILFRQGDALQQLKQAEVVAFDKTGTLTHGKPALTDLVLDDGQDENSVLAQLAAIQAHSEHPIALAVVQAARERGLSWPEPEAFQAISGAGVSAQLQGAQFLLGSGGLMREHGIALDHFAAAVQTLAEQGKTPVYIARDGKLLGILAVADQIRDTARAAIQGLHALGVKTVMITGDNAATARYVASQLGIHDTHAETLPENKVQVLQSLRTQYKTLAYVGDGINDAPALAYADVGIAVGGGTDIAMESAAVVLMNDDLRTVVTAIDLSRATLRNINQNLFWAFAYNVALIPVAAGALYPAYGILLSPMLGAAAMALSSVFVVSNALRLRRFRDFRT